MLSAMKGEYYWMLQTGSCRASDDFVRFNMQTSEWISGLALCILKSSTKGKEYDLLQRDWADNFFWSPLVQASLFWCLCSYHWVLHFKCIIFTFLHFSVQSNHGSCGKVVSCYRKIKRALYLLFWEQLHLWRNHHIKANVTEIKLQEK